MAELTLVNEIVWQSNDPGNPAERYTEQTMLHSDKMVQQRPQHCERLAEDALVKPLTKRFEVNSINFRVVGIHWNLAFESDKKKCAKRGGRRELCGHMCSTSTLFF